MAWGLSVDKQSVLSVLTLNLARFTRWPEFREPAFEEVGFNLCVIGGNVVQQSFAGLDGHTIKNKEVVVIHVSRLRNLMQCQVLYISGLKRNVLLQLLFELHKQPILTVGDSLTFLKAGGMVGLISQNGKIKLYINLAQVKHSGLIVNPRILKISEIVSFPHHFF